LKPPTKNVSHGRRSANSRPKKPAQAAPEPAAIVDAAVADSPPETTASAPPHSDWPEAQAEAAGPSGPLENPKRKRRRNKGKVSGPQHAVSPDDGESLPQVAAEPAEPTSAAPPLPPVPPQPASHPRRIRIDPELLAQRAWKIYLSEVSEEGVALVGDNDAKELARRCFRLAEIFLEEQARRH